MVAQCRLCRDLKYSITPIKNCYTCEKLNRLANAPFCQPPTAQKTRDGVIFSLLMLFVAGISLMMWINAPVSIAELQRMILNVLYAFLVLIGLICSIAIFIIHNIYYILTFSVIMIILGKIL